MHTNDLHLAATALRKGQILRLQRARGSRIETLAGSVWITIDGDSRDVVLGPDQAFDVDRDGDMLVSALSDARVVVLAPLPARHSGAPRTAIATGP